MTLITHIINEHYNLIALDGRIYNGKSQSEHFKKNINYKNGCVYCMGEFQNKDGWIYEKILECVGENELIPNFNSFLGELVNNISIHFPKTIIDFVYPSKVLRIKNGEYYILSPNICMISKPELKKFMEADIEYKSFTKQSIEAIDTFYNKVFQISPTNSFNENLNIILLVADQIQILRAKNNLTYLDIPA